jgi:hypothetical protein
MLGPVHIASTSTAIAGLTPTGARPRCGEYQGVYLRHVFAAAGRELRAVVRAASPAHGQLRDRLVAMAVATIGVDLICAVLAFLFERNAPGSEIRTFGSAAFWTSTQLLTVSSQLKNPLTVAGRILDVGMEAYAITVVGALAGSFGAFLVRRAEHDAREGGADTQRSSH